MDAAGARGGRPESKMQEMQICNTLNLDMRPAKALRRRFKKTIKRQMDELAHLVPQEEGEDENEQGEDAVEQGTKSKTSKTRGEHGSRPGAQDYVDDDDQNDDERRAAEARKALSKFNKKLTSKQLMQSDLADDAGDPDYKEKVAQCFEMRARRLQTKQPKEEQ